MGRPNKYDSHVKPRFKEVEEWLKQGATDKEISSHLGINPATFIEYKHRYPELNELVKNGRKVPIQEIKAALFRRATGHYYSEKKTIIQYEELEPAVLSALTELGLDVSEVGKRKLVRVEISDRYALPDPASCMILLKHWDKEEEWTNDPAILRVRKEELALKKEQIERGDW